MTNKDDKFFLQEEKVVQLSGNDSGVLKGNRWENAQHVVPDSAVFVAV